MTLQACLNTISNRTALRQVKLKAQSLGSVHLFRFGSLGNKVSYYYVDGHVAKELTSRENGLSRYRSYRIDYFGGWPESDLNHLVK